MKKATIVLLIVGIALGILSFLFLLLNRETICDLVVEIGNDYLAQFEPGTLEYATLSEIFQNISPILANLIVSVLFSFCICIISLFVVLFVKKRTAVTIFGFITLFFGFLFAGICMICISKKEVEGKGPFDDLIFYKY